MKEKKVYRILFSIAIAAIVYFVLLTAIDTTKWWVMLVEAVPATGIGFAAYGATK